MTRRSSALMFLAAASAVYACGRGDQDGADSPAGRLVIVGGALQADNSAAAIPNVSLPLASMISRQPRLASSRAKANPSPRDAPVMSAVFLIIVRLLSMNANLHP